MNKLDLYFALPWWLQNLVISIHGYKLKKERFNTLFDDISRFLLETDSWSKEEIKNYKEEQLFKIIEHAYNHCPFYREKYKKARLSPKDFKGLEDLQKFPILTKEEVRLNSNTMLADNIPRKGLIHGHTSGTTAMPLSFYFSPYNNAFYWAVCQRRLHRFGIHDNTKVINFAGKPVVPINQKKSPYWRFDFVLNRYFLPMQQLNRQKIPAIVQWLNKQKIDVFVGYPSIVTSLANEILDSGEMLTYSPRHFFTSAEKIYPLQRTILQEVFPEIQIHEFYGFSEQVASATHCKFNHYHEDFELGHLELNDSIAVENGTKGDILATGFTNYAMPFIRYKNGDSAVFSQQTCSCGLHSQMIDSIEGRTEDYIVTPEGNHIQRLDYVFKNIPSLKECQVIQKKNGEIIIRVVTRKGYSIKDEETLLKNVAQWISPTIQVQIEYVDTIPRTQSGKFRAVVSEL